ncbi:MAG: hypothetical protein QXU98_01655 [Candidatus Parvarchaeota archaeon]
MENESRINNPFMKEFEKKGEILPVFMEELKDKQTGAYFVEFIREISKQGNVELLIHDKRETFLDFIIPPDFKLGFDDYTKRIIGSFNGFMFNIPYRCIEFLHVVKRNK